MTVVEFLSYLRRLDVKIWNDDGRLRVSAPDGVLTPALRAELANRKAEIIEFLRKAETATRAITTPIPRVSRADDLLLSFTQQRIWISNQMGMAAFSNMLAAVRVTGPLVAKAVEQSLNAIVRRHEILRTTFVAKNGRPIQVIAPSLTVTLPVLDLQALPEVECEAHARQMLVAEARQPFDLAQGPLFRAGLLRLAGQDHILYLNFHHIISDAWSQSILVSELVLLYESFSHGRASTLPQLDIQYADYAQWQRQALQSDELKQAIAYWKQKLAGPLPVLELATGQPKSETANLGAIQRTGSLGETLTQEFKALCRREGVTLFMAMLAAFKTLLHRYTSQTDIVVGTPIFDRDRPEVQKLIGPFLNTLILRTDLAGNPTFTDLLDRVHQVVLEAFAHKGLAFEQLVEELQPERSLGHNPLFQVVFAMQNVPPFSLETPGLKLERFPFEYGAGTPPDLVGLNIEEGETDIVYEFEYDANISNHKIQDQFHTLLKGIVVNPNARLWELPLLTESEERQLAQWNSTQVDYADKRYIHEIFEAQAKRRPNALAVIFEDRTLTYAELDRLTNQLAHYLHKLGLGPESLVSVCMERSIEMIVALMGTVKAGAAYVPMDPTYPPNRLTSMLQDIAQIQPGAATVLLTQKHLTGRLHGCQGHIVCLDGDTISQESDERIAVELNDDNLVYMIYTSGSTGQPKGVMNTHGGLVNRLQWMQAMYRLDETDRVLQKTPFGFDVSVWEFFWTLMTGACLVVARPDGHKDSTYLAETVARHGVTMMHFVPSMLQAFVEEHELERCTSLRRVICSGEALPYDLQERFWTRLNHVELHNLYGPTEAAIDVTYWTCQRDSNDRCIPIGCPIANTQIHLLDPYGRPVPIGVPGELYIGGFNLARGYWQRPDLTAERFVPNPFGGQGARLYRTGDLARYRPDGSIEYLGRLDFQVKLRGFRIELGEIEAALTRHPAVREVVVIVRQDRPDDKRLVAYGVPVKGTQPSIHDLQSFLKERLPEYMVPSAFVMMESMPLTPNGKVDRKALPSPEALLLEPEEEYAAPDGPVARRLAQIWSEVLGVEKFSVQDTFFDLGGYSLLANQVIHQVNEIFGLDLSLRHFFEEPTIAGLSLIIEETLLDKLEQELRSK